jgi:hypothetical protein
MRNAAQCVGRVLRGKTDWGLMVFADKVRSVCFYGYKPHRGAFSALREATNEPNCLDG